MDKKIGFIGCGKMGQAILGGLIDAKAADPGRITVSTANEATLLMLKEKFKVGVSLDNKEIAAGSDVLFLAVQPSLHEQIIGEIKEVIQDHAVIITIAAGITLDMAGRFFGKKVKIVRTMPNTPSLVGEGMTAMCINGEVSKTDLEYVQVLLNSFGKTELVDESLMDSIPAISGSSPAFVYMFIEALADGGVRDGIPRKQAYKLAAQAVLGAAKMMLDTDKHPGALKDDVCTPGGSTIQAVAALEEKGFRSAVLEAMKVCTEKSKSYSNNC
ncbi:pyrroline-5-carboxylate reductase [Actinomycetes bacterium NPDC127524]